MKFPELRFVKFAAAAAVTEPATLGESVERSCMAFGMIGGLAAAKKEAGVLTDDDQMLVDKIARVCRNTYKFAKLLKNATNMLNGQDALHRTLSELSFGAMSSKVAYTQMIPLRMFDRAFESLDQAKIDEVTEKIASLSDTEKLLKIADFMQDGEGGGAGDDLGEDGEDMEEEMRKRMRKEKPMRESEEEEEENEQMMEPGEEEGMEGLEGMSGEEDPAGQIPPDVLAQLLQQMNSSTFEPLNEGMETGEGGENDMSEVARQLAQMGIGGEQAESIAPILASLAMAGQHA